MQHVLYVGQDPTTVDFSDPSLPPGMDAGKIQAGIDKAAQALTARGWDARTCMITPDDAGIAVLTHQLESASYACVVIGGGLRIPKTLRLFEQIINAIHRHAPQAAIAFNTSPDDTAEAAARWL
ncbi:hypothetical protein SAMN05428989_3326 [Pseudoxanthomonas sp. GM95]|uniref:hypothetical protein n=1 Tax=Pseudoxanthomonas sp. GM95 TaxID=1881043 RepID=UPI0008D2FA72|nr:hypothetical protein [Pseudoxanthomonas sp. GM95]SEM19364.1 hypothetical protein SAMN05428989_3326 [Pseudoxanthomonas sp. GM95]